MTHGKGSQKIHPDESEWEESEKEICVKKYFRNVSPYPGHIPQTFFMIFTPDDF